MKRWRSATASNSGFPEALALAHRHLRHRDRFVSEIEAFLREAGLAEHRQAVVDRLLAQGVLHDERVAQAWADQALDKKGWPLTRVRAALEERGAAPEAVESALAGRGDDGEVAGELLSEGLAGGDPPARVARRLIARGFDPDCVADVLAAAGFGPGEGA